MSEIINIKKPTLKIKTSQNFIMFINQNKTNDKYRTCADYIKAFNETREKDKQIKRSSAYWIFKKLEIKTNEPRTRTKRSFEPSEGTKPGTERRLEEESGNA